MVAKRKSDQATCSNCKRCQQNFTHESPSDVSTLRFELLARHGTEARPQALYARGPDVSILSCLGGYARFQKSADDCNSFETILPYNSS
jgi:hypothetical protein